VRWVWLSGAALLTGCGPDVGSNAAKCGVSDDQLREAINAVSRMSPYSGKTVGKCDLIVDDGRNVSVITPEIERSVENMIAREKAEANK
jgi:hypothetical protein